MEREEEGGRRDEKANKEVSGRTEVGTRTGRKDELEGIGTRRKRKEGMYKTRQK